MEKAILKTLAYADIFDYPLTIFEIHKWLVGRKATLRQVESAVGRLVQTSKCKVQSGYYFLPKKDGVIAKRKRREKQSANYLKRAQLLGWFLKLIPWLKLVGISGGLAMENAQKSDDIDLFLITSKNRLWITRLLALGLLTLMDQRRKAGDAGRKIAGKLCLNILLEEDKLDQRNKDIYLVHEVLQMKVLWQRDGIYFKYLADNEWAFKFLPNWVGEVQGSVLSSPRRRGSNSDRDSFNWIPAFAGMTIENLAKWLQLRMMSKPKGMERIEDGALYFHPQDCRLRILSEYRKKLGEILQVVIK